MINDDPDDLRLPPNTGHSEPRNLGRFLEETRKLRGMTRAGLAQATRGEVSEHTIAKYERERTMPSASSLAIICLCLRLDPRKALLYALKNGAGEWLNFGGNDPYGEEVQLWKEFQEFLSDLEESPPITDPMMPSAQPRASSQAQISQLASAVAQLATAVASAIPVSTENANGPDQKDQGRHLISQRGKAAPTASRSKKQRRNRGPDK